MLQDRILCLRRGLPFRSVLAHAFAYAEKSRVKIQQSRPEENQLLQLPILKSKQRTPCKRKPRRSTISSRSQFISLRSNLRTFSSSMLRRSRIRCYGGKRLRATVGSNQERLRVRRKSLRCRFLVQETKDGLTNGAKPKYRSITFNRPKSNQLLKSQQSSEVDVVLDASFIKAWSIRHPTDSQIGFSDAQVWVALMLAPARQKKAKEIKLVEQFDSEGG
jgi:hypothetical protein